MGAIESFEPVLLNPVGTDLSGFILLRGSVEKLEALKRNNQFIERMIRGQYLIAGFGVVDGYLGANLQRGHALPPKSPKLQSPTKHIAKNQSGYGFRGVASNCLK